MSLPKTRNDLIVSAAETLLAEHGSVLVAQEKEVYYRHDDGSYSFAHDLLRRRAIDLLDYAWSPGRVLAMLKYIREHLPVMNDDLYTVHRLTGTYWFGAPPPAPEPHLKPRRARGKMRRIHGTALQ